MARPRVIIATTNLGKVAEISELLSEFDIGPRPPHCPEIEETGASFLENAQLKAVGVSCYAGEVALADDSGLVVPSLGGEPGVNSARYSGESSSDQDNINKLLRQLEGSSDRAALFHCTVVLARRDLVWLPFSGEVRGRIASTPRGVAGFGYDPVFIPNEGDGRSFAEMSQGEKNSISHRAKAVRKLADFLTSKVGRRFIEA